MESKPGQIMQNMKELTRKVGSMEQVLSSGLINQYTLENSLTITYMAKVCTLGLMEESMRVNGGTTKCMERVHLSGEMVDNTLENITMTRNKVMVSSFGLMVDAIEVSG